MPVGPMRSWMVLSALLLAGCSDPHADPAAAPAPPTSHSESMSLQPVPGVPQAVTVEDVPFRWSGHTKEGVWVCMEQSGIGQCPAGQQVAPDGGHVTAIAYQGNLTALEFTMSWQADPTQTGLVVAAYGNTSSGRGLLGMAQGTSPLALALDLTDAGLVPDHALVLMAWPEGKTPTSPSLFVDASQQAFTVEGTLRQTGRVP